MGSEFQGAWDTESDFWGRKGCHVLENVDTLQAMSHEGMYKKGSNGTAQRLNNCTKVGRQISALPS